ncbi:MAG TPA: SRPBCC family protein [Acidimicrobiia bacterium]|nr:SRPBCC family protein [Acidimicrobiia bacterium]
MSEDVVSVERVIPAPPEKIFELLVYPDKHQEIDGSGSVRDAKGENASERLKLGSKFGMKMKMGLPSSMVSTVVEFEEGRRIAWHTWPPFGPKIAGGRIWRYLLEPVEGGTKVTESWDITQEKLTKPLVGLGGAAEKTSKNMAQTLENIEKLVAAE